jgi:DNA-binding transcriptional LysR family regulator
MLVFEFLDITPLMQPSVAQLEVFLAVVNAGSFRAAAKQLRCAQSVVSYAIAQIETALGRHLFDRTGSRPRLTDSGDAVASQARVVLGEMRRLFDTSCETSSPHKARIPLSIVVDAIVPPKLLVPLLLEASHRLPGFELRVRCESKFSLLELLNNGAGDVALSGASGSVPRGITRETLRTFQLVPVASPSHQIARSTKLDKTLLRDHLQIVLSERSDSGSRQPLESVAQGRYLRVSDLALKLELILGGVGWGFLPLEFIESGLALGTLVRLRLPRSEVGTLSLLYRTNTGATDFGDLVRERLALRIRVPRKTSRRGA